ncbi:MAG TPA: rhodanese-like domain-containing protein [Thermoanaerobaculia bacterium]|jgi:3-mercaptopyruvate sulfurtransferase SseA
MRWIPRRGLALAGTLLLVAAVPVLAAPQEPAKTPSLTPQAPAAAPAETPAAPTQETARRISVAEARQALAKGEAVLVDVRPKAGYDMGHAQGAISLPLSELGSRAGELPKDKLVITYCT